MAGAPLNPTKNFSRQGVDPKMVYIATVVDNVDTQNRARVRARIPEIHGKIADEHLPWALPSYQHHTSALSGRVDIPPVGALIGLKFPTGDVMKPVQCECPATNATLLPEALKNYPHRKVVRYHNGMFTIVDTLTNELIVHNPGDYHLIVRGDCTQTVIGNHQLLVTADFNDLPAYLRNASDLRLAEVEAKNQQGISINQKRGSQKVTITGDQNIEVMGDRNVVVRGNSTLTVYGNHLERIVGEHTIKSRRSNTN